MISWQGESLAFTVYLPNKPTPIGFCLKVLCDGRSWVLLSLESVEEEFEQSAKLWLELGKAAACTVRVTQPYHGGSRRLIFADSWFGSIPNALLPFKDNLESICNIKNTRKGFPRKQLFHTPTLILPIPGCISHAEGVP